MPLVDQDGRMVDDGVLRARIPATTVVRIEVRHDEVLLFDAEDRPAFQVFRPTHPGAGLSFSCGDHIEMTREVPGG